MTTSHSRERSMLAHLSDAVLAIAIAVTATAVSGCSDSGMDTRDDEPSPAPPLRSTVDGLFDQMERAFATRDSSLLEEMLDEAFICNPLDDPEGAIGDWYCSRTSYLAEIGRLFRDSTAAGLTLDIVVNNNVPSTDESCLDCRQTQATATLRVSTPGNGIEPRVFAIDTPVTFLVARDARDPRLWILRRQLAYAPAAARVPANATDWLDCNCHRGVIINEAFRD